MDIKERKDLLEKLGKELMDAAEYTGRAEDEIDNAEQTASELGITIDTGFPSGDASLLEREGTRIWDMVDELVEEEDE